MTHTDVVRVQLKQVLDCSADEAWELIRSPRGLSDVSWPLAEFEPAGDAGFPDRWPEGEHTAKVRGFFGLVPMGEQIIAVRYAERHGARILEDGGRPVSGPLAVITSWRHRMAVAPTEGGRTLYRDRLDVSAGALTPVVWLGLWAFWQWRAAGLRRLARRPAARLTPRDGG